MSRARKQEKNELIKISKEISRRMGDFEDSVQKLQDLKDSLDEMDDALAQQATINNSRLQEMNQKFEENKIKAVTQAAQELNKVLINKEELEEIQASLKKVRETGQEELEKFKAEQLAIYETRLANELKVQKLEHECETASIKADVETYKKEVENLNQTLERMAEELKSQKQLTADVAGLGRNKNTGNATQQQPQQQQTS